MRLAGEPLPRAERLPPRVLSGNDLRLRVYDDPVRDALPSAYLADKQLQPPRRAAFLLENGFLFLLITVGTNRVRGFGRVHAFLQRVGERLSLNVIGCFEWAQAFRISRKIVNCS